MPYIALTSIPTNPFNTYKLLYIMYVLHVTHNGFLYYTSMEWPVSPVLLEDLNFPNPSSEPPYNLLPTLHYYTLSTVHSMVLSFVSTCLPRDKHPSWFGEIVSPYINGMV